jgi:hypothetical protein
LLRIFFAVDFLDKISVRLPKVSSAAVLNAGALNLKSIIPSEDLDTLLEVYSDAICATFYVGLGLTYATVIGALLRKWESVKPAQKDEGSIDLRSMPKHKVEKA